MKTWELQTKPGFEALTRAERPSPNVGARDVKVRVHAVSLNYRDLLIAKDAAASSKSCVAPPLERTAP